MGFDRFVALGERVDRQCDDDAVERTAAPVLLQEVEEAKPFRCVDIRLAFLLDVAARSVDQHRVLGEEPIAVTRAADALQVIGEVDREIETRLAQCRGLAGGRRSDDDIPRHLAQELAATELAPL